MAGKKNKSHSKNKRSRRHTQSGGDPWATVLPMEYSGGANKHYFEAGSPELNTPGQVSVSRGTISADGMSAGPDLYPTMQTMVGGGRRHRSRTHKKRRAGGKGKKLSKRRSSRKTGQRGGGCGCGGSTPQLAGNYML
jgi:hypothetical protein